MKQPCSASSSMIRCALWAMAASLRRFRMTRLSWASSSSSSSVQACDSSDLETVKRFVGVGPFGIDDLPRHSALKDGFGHDFEVVIEGLDLYLRRCAFFIGHG